MKYLFLFSLFTLTTFASKKTQFYVTADIDADLDGFVTTFVNKERPTELMFCKYTVTENEVITPTKFSYGEISITAGVDKKSTNKNCYHGVGHDFGTYHFDKVSSIPNGRYSFQINGQNQGILIVKDQVVLFRTK